MKREGRIHKGVSIGAYSILIAFMLLLLWTVLRYPGNHLIPWQMALGVAAATVLLLAAGAAWNKIYTVTGRKNSLYAVALVLFGVLLYVVSLSRQGNENTLLDYTYVYRDALNLANGRELEDTNYFLTYSNNLKPMLLLSCIQNTSASTSLKKSIKPFPTQARRPFTFQDMSFFMIVSPFAVWQRPRLMAGKAVVLITHPRIKRENCCTPLPREARQNTLPYSG